MSHDSQTKEILATKSHKNPTAGDRFNPPIGARNFCGCGGNYVCDFSWLKWVGGIFRG